jgi:nucleoside-diphosphate kinase
MTVEQTLSIIKPDAVEKNLIGTILARFEQNSLKIVAAKMVHLTAEQGKKFYAVHKDRPFYHDLVAFISSGPIMVQVLEGENAIAKNRKIMGATNPADASPETIRADFAESIERNAVHGSDAKDTAKFEIDFFFKPDEIYSR